MTTLTWHRSPEGYTSADGRWVIERHPKRVWVLRDQCRDGLRVDAAVSLAEMKDVAGRYIPWETDPGATSPKPITYPVPLEG